MLAANLGRSFAFSGLMVHGGAGIAFLVQVDHRPPAADSCDSSNSQKKPNSDQH